jgi:predicted phosphohydrolase
MGKWTRTRRDPGRTYSDEDTERTERMIARVRRFFEEGVPEDEQEFIVAVKTAKPKITASELKDVVTQFRAVVSERQQRGLGRR